MLSSTTLLLLAFLRQWKVELPRQGREVEVFFLEGGFSLGRMGDICCGRSASAVTLACLNESLTWVLLQCMDFQEVEKIKYFFLLEGDKRSFTSCKYTVYFF